MSTKIYDVRSLPGDSAFLIDDGLCSVLCDTGFGFTGYEIANNIKKVLKNRELNYILLTHSHYDHALAAPYIKRIFPNVKIVAGEYAAKIFKKGSAKAVMRDLDKKWAQKSGVLEYDDLSDELMADIVVKDQDVIRAGDMTFTAIHLPGHTKCSFGFYLKEEKMLIACETLGVYGGRGVVVPSYLVGYQITLDSFSRLKDIDVKSILTPHFGLLNEADANEYISLGYKNSKETGLEIAKILSQNNSSDEAYSYFKSKYYNSYVQSIYPLDAMELNTGIMINLIKNELL